MQFHYLTCCLLAIFAAEHAIGNYTHFPWRGVKGWDQSSIPVCSWNATHYDSFEYQHLNCTAVFASLRFLQDVLVPFLSDAFDIGDFHSSHYNVHSPEITLKTLYQSVTGERAKAEDDEVVTLATVLSHMEELYGVQLQHSMFTSTSFASAIDWCNSSRENEPSSYHNDDNNNNIKIKINNTDVSTLLHTVATQLERLCSLIHVVYTNVESARYHHTDHIFSSNKEHKNSNTATTGASDEAVKVLVVGAGPVGLMSAIEAYSKGAKVTVVEKRSDYRRNVWFDLEPRPWSASLEKLESWGLKYQDMEHMEHEGVETVVTVRTQNLERFMSKLVWLLDIPIYYGKEFLTYCPPRRPRTRATAILHSTQYQHKFTSNIQYQEALQFFGWKNRSNFCNGELLTKFFPADQHAAFVHTTFDVLIGCDGLGGSVKRAADIESPLQTEVQVVGAGRVDVENLSQTTVIVNFKANTSDGDCPRLKKTPQGHLLDPRYPSFVVKGVTSVWKRFYIGHCQLQILFLEQKGQQIVQAYQQHKPHREKRDLFWRESKVHTSDTQVEPEEWQQQGIPWETLKEVANVLMEQPYTSVAQLQSAIGRKSTSPALFDIDVFEVQIRKANTNTMLVKPQHFVHHQADEWRVFVVSLAGDTSVTAHYRLGVGVNNAFLGLRELGQLIQSLNSIGTSHMTATSVHRNIIEEAVACKEVQAQQRMTSLVQFELSTMLYESYCEYSIFFDMTKDNYWETQMLYEKDEKVREWVQLREEKEVIAKCKFLSEQQINNK